MVDADVVIDELNAVLVELLGADVDLDDIVAVVAAVERAAEGVDGRDPAEVARLLCRLDAAISMGTEAAHELGLEGGAGPAPFDVEARGGM